MCVCEQSENIVFNVTTKSNLSPRCHMCHKIVTDMSQDCLAVSRIVAEVSRDVTEMSRPSHIFVTRYHKLSHHLSHSVTLSHRVSNLC